jgi:hypothetical protein
MPRNLNNRQRQVYARLLNTPPRLPPEMPTVWSEFVWLLKIGLFAAVAAGGLVAFVYACVVGVP